MMEKIRRNDEEQVAYEALVDALRNAPEGDDMFATAEAVEYRLLELGFVITKIETITTLEQLVDEVNAESRRSSSLGFFD